MSAQSAKKKRIGSRRRVANQNEISKADEFHVGDSTSVAGSHIPEEHTESLNVLGHFDNSQSESQHPPSPEFSGGRRKLGSSRRLKGRHVKDSVTESYHEAREEVEDKTREKETTVSKQTPLAIQPERQEALSQGSEHDDMSATPEYSSEIQKTTTTNYPEADLESLIPKGRNLPTDLDENENDSEVVSDSCKLAETTQEGNDISILHSEKVKESAHLVGISELTSLSALSCPTVDQQLIDQSNFKEMPEEKLPSVCSVTEKEGKERDDDTESFRHDGNLQGSYLVSESHVESVVMQFSTTPEITTEKISPTENTEVECSVGQATILSPKEELPTDEEQNEHFNLSEVRGAHHSEDDVNKQHEQEIRLTEKHMPHDDTENSEIISGNLTEQTEVSDTYQSELTEKSTDGSPTNQDISYPEDKRDEHLTDENNFEALEQKNEDYHVYDTTEPQISDIERVDSALGQVYEIEGRVEDDIKPSAEQTAHQEKEGLFSEVEESESSLQTVQSEINASLDSRPQQDDTSFNPIGNRRKLGSSRRNRGRRHVKDSVAESDHEHKEDAESTSGNEAIETAQMLLATERTSQEELSQGSEHDVIPETHDSSLYSATVTDYSSEVQSPTTTNYPEADLESLIRESENLQKDHDDRETHFKVEVSDKSVGATLEGAVKSDSLQGQEVKGQHPSEDAVNKEHEQEVKPTENQEMPQIDNSSESVIRDATENSEIISGNMTDQIEVSDTYQSELTEKGTDRSPTNQDISYPEDKQDGHPTKEVVYEIEGRVEDDIKPSAEQTAHQEKEGLFSEVEESESSLQTMQSEINAPLDSQPQQDDISFNPIGNRRKLGSSRRNRGRQHVKDSAAESDHEHKEDVESTRGNEAIETAQILLATEITSQEGSEHDVIPETHDSSLYSATMTDYSSEVQSPTTTNYPEADLESLIPESENFQEDHDDRETHFKVEVSDKSVGATLEGSDKSDSLQSQEVKGQHHSEDAVNKEHEQEVKPTENQEMPQIDKSSESVIRDATENSEIISGNLTDQTEVSDTYQSELTEKSTDGSPTNQDISYPEDKQDEHPTDENNFEALEQKNEDYHVYDTTEPQISDIERVDSALGQVYEIEGRVEDDIKPSAEQTAHQEKEGLFSEVEESESSLLTVQSEINATLDSQPQQDDISFNPIGNRRKLGSSRRNRGRRHVKDSAAESDHEPTEDVVGNTRDNEPLETTEMSLTIETAVQEKSMETMLEGMDTFDTPQTEDVSDQVKENAHFGTVVDIDLHSSSTVDQQTIDQSNFREMPDEELLNVSSVTEKENKERDEDTELFRQVGHLQTNYLVSEDIESSITPEITTEKHSSREHTEPEYSVEQAIFSSPEEELQTNEEQNEIFKLPEVKGEHHSEDAVNKEHEQEVKPTENQEMPQIDNSSESVMCDATENSELISGNLTDQTEVSDIYQSELTEKSTDGSPTNQDISYPEDKQDEHLPKELVYEIEGRVEDDIKPSAEQTVHQEKEGLFSEVEESESSLLTVQSEINAPLDSRPQQDDTSFNPIGNRRKLGSSRRNRGRQHVKDSVAESDHEHKEDVESTSGNEAIETAQMLLATERTSQEELSQGTEHDVIPETHDSSLYSATMTDYSSEVQSPTTTNYPEADLESLISESENLQEDHDDRETHFKVEVSDKPVGATLEGSDKSDSLQGQEVKGQHHSEDAVNKEHEQEVKPTENQEMPQIDNSSESVIRDEVSDTYQSELTEKSTDGSPTNQDISYPEDKQDEHPTDENNFEALEQKNEDYHVYDTKEPQISDIERVDTAPGQVYEIEGRVEDDIKPGAEQTAHQEKEGLFSEVEESESSLQTMQSEINASLDSRPQQDDTSFNPIGNRSKLGSSRRNRGRQHVKDSAAESDHEHKEDVKSTSGNEAIETAQILLATERTSQEELSQGSEHDVIPETHDISLYSATVTDYSSEVQSPTTTNYPEADLESLIPESENLQEDHDERETHFKVEVSDKSVGATLEGAVKSDSLQGQEVKGQHPSEDAVNKDHEHEVKPTENQEMPQIHNSSENVMHDATENSEIISGNLTDQTEVSDTYQSELAEKSTDGSPTNQDISYPDDKQDEHPTKEVLYEIEGRVEDDIKPSAEQTAHQEKEGLFSEVEESESSLLTVQSEINAPLDSQPQQDDTSFNPIGNRRKLGSSRRHRGRRHVKDSAAESDHEPTEDVVGNTRDNEPLETTEMSLTIETAVQEKSMETMLEGMDTFDTPQTEDISDQVKENAHFGTVVGIDLHSSTTVDQQMIDQSNFRDIPDEELLNVSSVTEKENKERDEDTELFRQVGHLQTNYLVSEDIESSITPEITTEKHSSREHTEPEYSVEQAIFSSPEEELPTNEEQNEIFNLPEQEVKPIENQEMPQIDNSSESVMCDATENSELISGNLTDQTEVSDTYQSELTEKNTDGSPTNQDISCPEDKQDEHPTKEVVYEIEGRVEDDIKPSAEQTVHQEKEGLFSEVEESESSLLTVQSEINASLDSQPQQDDTSFNPIGNRRKLGSSRRNRGRRHVKDSAAESDHEHKEDVESTSGNEAIETAQMLLATERTSQEELSQGSEHDVIPETHDSSLYSATMTDYSSEVQSPTTTNYPEADLESLIPESENLQEDHDDRETHFKVEVSDKPVGATLEGSDKSDSLQGQEVKGQHHSEDAVNKEHEQEVKPTENQEMPQIDNSSESVIRDEVSDTYQSELTEKSTDGSPTNQDISYPEDKQDEHPTDENNFEALEQKNEDYHVYDTKEPQISDIERVDTAPGQVYEIEGRVEDDIKPGAEQTAHQEKEGLFSEVEESESSLQTMQSEINASLDSRPQQDDTSFNPIGNRRKLGSSRRNRGRQHVKDSAAESDHEHKEDVKSTSGNEAIETAQILLATERTSQEELSQGSEHDVIPETHDSSLYSATVTDYSSEVQSPTTTNYPEADLESLIPESENLQEDHDDRETHFKVEVSDKSVGATLEGAVKSDSLQGQEVKGQHPSEDAVNKDHEHEVKPTENQEMPQIHNSSENVMHDATENSEIISGNLTDQTEVSDTYQSELAEKSTDGSPTNQDISYPDDKQDEHPTKEVLYEIEGRVEDDIKPSAEQTVHQEKEELFSEVEESESSLLTVQSEINAPLDSQPQQDDTSFNPIGNRRKLGSSRRNRGRQHVKDSAAESDHEHKEDVESTSGNEAIETAQMLLATERTSQEELSQGTEHDVIPETHDSSLYSATMTDYSSEVQSPTTTNYPEADLESLISESENLQEDHDDRETHFKVEVSDKPVGATLEGSDKSDSLQGQEVKGQHPSEDAVNKEHEQEVKPTENQEMPQIDNSSESVIRDEVSDTYQSELTEKSTDGSPTNQDISYPEDKQDEHPTDENNFEALEQKNEDYHVYDTTEPQISDIERVDSALGQVYEIEGRVEDDIKPSAEQTAHQEKEGLFSEVEESESSLLTVQSEINAPLDSQPQQDDISFNPIGNRRKLGSSRRHRGRRHVKDSAAESDHEPTEDVVGNTRDNEPLETTEMSLTIETAVQEKSMETMLEGMDTFDTPQTEDVSDQVKENAHFGTVVGIDLHSSTTVDQQMIDQSNFRDIPDEELLNVSSVTEKENKERDEDTELFRQVGHLQTNYLVSEDIESSITPEITTEKHSSREHTEPEYSVEQAIFSSPEEELPTNEEQNEIFNLPEQEVKPIENQEMPQIDNSSESVMHDATENSELISGNLTDQTEVSDTYQSELTEKNTDGSPTNQDISCPEDKQDEHPTKEVVYEIEGRVEDDIKPSAEQTVHQEKEGLFSEVEESESSLLTVQSEINASLDSQPQQDDTSFNPIGNRRKLGSSRRNRGRRHVKDSAAESDHEHKEDVESTSGNEAIETAQMLLATERTSQEELSQGTEHDVIPETHDISLYSATVTDYSSEVQSPTTTNYPEADLESLIPESENLQEHHDERETHFKVEVSDKSVGATLEGSDKSDSLQSQEVKGEHHSEDAVNKEHEHKVKPTENQEMPQIDNSSESVIRDEVSDTYQSELTEKSTDGSPTNQDISYPDDKQDEHPTKEVLYEIEGRVEDDIKPSAEQTAHQEKEGLFSEVEESESSLQTVQSEINAPLDSQPQQDDTSFNPIGNRRKLGSSRRNRGRQHVKDSVAESDHEHKEDVESTSGNEAIETAQMLLATERMSQEELSQGSEHDVIPETHDSSLYSATMTDYSSEVQSPTTTNYPEADLESLIPKSENLQEDHDERETHFKVEVSDKSVGATLEGSDKSDSLQSQEVKGQHHSEDAVNKEHEQEVKPTENQEMPQIDKSQPQQDDISFNPIGNRRKLGSSRRHRGRQHVMDSAAESDHEPTEDVVGNTRDNEPLEITEMSLTIETAVQEKSMETMLEGMDTFDTPQTEDVSDQVKHVGTQERDEDTESVRRDENLQTNYLVSETQAKSEDIESSISPKVSSENSSPGEHTEIECSVEQAAFSSSKEELSTNEERTEHVSLGARPSEDAVNKVHEEAIKPIQMQEMCQIDNSSIKDSELTLQTMQSEHFDPQHLDNSQSINEQTHTGFSPKGHRRKLGSSRRQKGRLHVEDTTKMSLPMETMRQEELKEQTDLDFKFAGEIRSTVNNEGNTEKMLEEDTIVATDMTSSSGKDDFVKSNEEVNEEECKLIKETENLSQLRCDTVKMDLIQSLDVSATAVNMQQTNDTPENVGDVTKQDYETEAESSMHVQVYGLDEDGEQFEDTTKKDHEAHEMNVSPEITHAERFSAPHDKTDTLAPFDVGLEENIQAEPAVAVSEESGISSQQGIQEQANLDDGENLQGGSKQKRRKLGSTRRTQLNRKPEEKTVETKDLNADADMRSLDKMEVVEELTMTVTAEGSQNENAKPSQSPEDKEQQETISKAFFPEQSASHNEEVVNPVKFVHVADVRDNERNVEPSQIDDFTATEMHISDLMSANTEDSTGTGITDRGFVSSWGTTQSTRGDEERPESVNITQDQSLKSAEVPVVADFEIVKAAVRGGAAEEHTNAQASKQESDDADEGAHNKHLEMKNASPNLDSTNRKRKMGSSRRNLVSRTKREDLNQKQEVDDEATETETNVGDVKTVSFSGNVEDEPQLHTEHKDSEQREESETVAYSHTDEENPVSHGQLVETEHQLTPSYLPSTPSTSPKHDSMSESSPGGRRRKMGSHRKSHGHQNNENQTAGGDRKTDNERDVRSITDESAIKTTEEPNERPLGLDKISEVDQSDKKPSSNISTAKSEKTPEPGTPVQRPNAEIVLGQESQHKFSLAGDSRGADLRANAFNVMMVGESSVGKSSFMKRAQSGKFSLEIPASIGLDSCMWTVVVDGKPVVLQLWDTAGQERFHSITRQIFHKAHAFLLMYDITSSQSFSAVSYWANCIQEGASENVTILLAGNKCDHAERQVNTEKAEALAKEYNFEFMECSAATGENVVHCLETVARMLSQKIDTREEDLVLHKEPQQRKSGCC